MNKFECANNLEYLQCKIKKRKQLSEHIFDPKSEIQWIYLYFYFYLYLEYIQWSIFVESP